MTQTVELYTAQEQGFLQGVLDLLKIDYTRKSSGTDKVISSITYNFDCNKTELEAIAGMMKANYDVVTGRSRR